MNDGDRVKISDASINMEIITMNHVQEPGKEPHNVARSVGNDPTL